MKRITNGNLYSALLMFILLIFIGASLSAFAQDYRARLSGIVTDPSGALVANATVEVQSKATGLSTKTTTNDRGVYLTQFLEPGDYKVTISVTGFKTYINDNLNLRTNQSLGLDVQLEVGNPTETINVVANSATLETETASRALNITNELAQELPIVARNPILLANQLPGATFRGPSIFRQPFANGAIANFTINGGTPANNEFQIDGAPNNARAANLNNNISYMPVAEAVREVTVLSHAYDASYGKTSGGIINIVMRGGTDEFHASGWWYLRRKQLNANSFFNNSVSRPRAEQNNNQWGFKVDGPVKIPFLFSNEGKVKLFYFGTYENYAELQPAPLELSVPEAEMRNGDFSKLRNAAGELVQIYDPLTTRTDASGNVIRDPFPNNIIPSNRINPVSAAVAKFFSAPNRATPAGRRYGQLNFFLPNYAFDFTFYNLSGRVDAKLGEKDAMYFRYARNLHQQVRTLNGILGKPGENAFNPFKRENNAYLLDWVRTFNPTTVVNVRLNVARYVEGSGSDGNFGFNPTTLGLSSALVNQLAVNNFFGVWQFAQYTQLGSGVNIETNNNYSLQGSLVKTWGTHNFKAGADVRRLHYLETRLGNPLRFGFGNNWTRRVWNDGASEINSGDGFATFLLGYPSDGQADFLVRPFWRQWYAAPYLQDDWKVTRNLTLNLGVRYDINTTPDEKYNRLNVGFDTSAVSPIRVPSAAIAAVPAYPGLSDLANLRGGLRFAGVDGFRQTASATYANTLQPRIGFAWQLRNKLVMRGGYGLFFANWPTNDFLNTAGFSITTGFNASGDGGRTPLAAGLNNPYPNGILRPIGSSRGLNTFVGSNFNWWNPRAQMPRVHQFSFGFQYQLTNSSSLDVSYVGSRTTSLITARSLNLPSDDFAAKCDPARGGTPTFCNTTVPNPFRGLAEFVGTGYGANAQVTRFDLARPFPQFAGGLTQTGRNDGRGWYDSLQLVYRQRLGKGVVMDANYVFSKQISEEGWINEFAGQLQHGLNFMDRPHVFKLSTHLELPFGQGRRFLSDSNGFVKRLIGGWDANVLTILQSGEPADLPGRAIMLRDPKVKVNRNQFQVRGFNGCVLQRNADGTRTPFGYSVSRNGCSATDFSQYAWEVLPTGFDTFRVNPFRSGQIRMPKFFNVDLSLNKTVQITERLRFQFRAEAFNAFNRFNIFSVRFNANVFDPNFGTYFPSEANTFSGQQRDSQPRAVQLGMKLMW